MLRTLYSGIDDCLSQTKVVGVKTLKSVVEGTNYARSLKAIVILAHAVESLKWEAFTNNNDMSKYGDFLSSMEGFQEALSKTDQKYCQNLYEICLQKSGELKLEFEAFCKQRTEQPEMCKYWDGLIKLASILKNLIAADRGGDWEGHLQAIRDLLPIFCESGSFNYQRYGSVYLEFMRKLPTDYPIIYDHFKKGKFIAKTNIGFFRAVGADMKLEQTIQRSKKGSGVVIGQTKQEAFVTEWELAYHEVLAISKRYKEITGSQLANSDADFIHRELTARSIVEYNEALSKVINFMKEKGNPYFISANQNYIILHHVKLFQKVLQRN